MLPSSFPIDNGDDEWKQRPAGYRFIHAMQIKFPNDAERLGRIFRALSGCPVPVVFSVGYTVQDTVNMGWEIR